MLTLARGTDETILIGDAETVVVNLTTADVWSLELLSRGLPDDQNSQALADRLLNAYDARKQIRVMPIRFKRGCVVVLGIDAPRHVAVDREEIAKQKAAGVERRWSFY